MKNSQTSALFKAICVFLSCLFFGASVIVTVTAVLEILNSNVIDTPYYRELYGNDLLASTYMSSIYVGETVVQYQYDQKTAQGEPPTSAEKYDYQKAMQHLRSENTNFRYRILDLDGKVLYSNLSGSEDLSKVCSHRYFSGILQTEQENILDPNFYLRPFSADDSTLEDYLNQHCILDNGKYYNRQSYEEYQDELKLYEEAKQEIAAAIASVPQDQEPFTEDEAPAEETAPEPIPPENNCHPLVAVVEWGIQDAAMDVNGIDDEFHQLYWNSTNFQNHLPWYIGLVAVFALLCLLFFGLLLWAVGHKAGVEGAYLSPVHKLPGDVVLCVAGGAAAGIVFLGATIASQYFDYVAADWNRLFASSGTTSVWEQIMGQPVVLMEIIFLTAVLAELVALPFFTTLSAQVKNHCFLHRLLLSGVFRLTNRFLSGVFRLIKRFLCWCGHSFGALLIVVSRGVRAFWVIPVLYLAFHLLLGALTVEARYDGFYFLLACGLIGGGFVALCWWLYGWKRATDAAKRLAEGDLLHQTSLQHISWDMKRHIENLNAISIGMNKAVEEQLKSERFRTELITNVSHDLKTPLTSIINYVDLLKKRDIQDETAKGYIAVLDQKSQRLKTLTEDLVEASKAATGVLNVSCERLDAGQLLRQAVGEYEERLEKSHLSVVTTIPPQPVYISADGRHLWRILDNLLNNCAKYAMPHTRIYATVEERDGFALLSLKNISAEPLNIPTEELMERFVRGDSSRTNEGSGLGLSIAQSLANLQGAEFNIRTDGDLFKAELKLKLVG